MADQLQNEDNRKQDKYIIITLKKTKYNTANNTNVRDVVQYL